MCAMELAIVGTIVEVEEEFGFAEAMEARIWYHEEIERIFYIILQYIA